MTSRATTATTAAKNGTKPKATKQTNPIIDTLQGRLADLIDLHWQIKQAHWNIVGPNFIGVHRLLDEQADMARLIADEIAERVRALHAPAEGTIRLAVTRTTIDEFPHGLVDWKAAIGALVERYEQLSAQFKDAADAAGEAEDIGTEDLYIESIRIVDKAAFLLRAHLE